VRLLFFAALRDIMGAPACSVQVEQNATVADALRQLVAREPRLEHWLPHVRVAVNFEYAGPEQVLHEGDEVALIPPVSGGCR
jgi:molybdopterin converting factor subunit 1